MLDCLYVFIGLFTNSSGGLVEQLEKYLKALVLLQLNGSPEEDRSSQKPELLLHKAGFTAAEVADMLGKSKAAAAKAITRARKAEEEG